METSKKLLISTGFLAVATTLLGIVLGCFGLAIDIFAVAIPLAWADYGVCIGYYCWKSKNENRAKYAQRFINKFAEQYGVDAALRAAETVLKD